jgi:hypothetical protein
VVCFDIDPAAVELNYRQVRSTGETGILPLLLDMMNPSPSLGWANEERQSLEARGPVDTLMALRPGASPRDREQRPAAARRGGIRSAGAALS